MGTSISNQNAAASAEGTDLIPIDKAGAGKKLTVAQIKTYVIDEIEAISAGVSVASGNGIYLLQSGVLKPVDIDLVTQRALDRLYDKDAASLADANLISFEASGVQKTITATNFAEYVRGEIEAAILDVSNLSDGSGSLATSDYMLVTQGTTGKRITVQNLYDAIYAGLAAHVAAATNQASPASTDILYLVRGSTPYKVTLANLATLIAASATIDGSGTAGNLTKWSDSNTLMAGPTIGTGSFGAGSDEAIPTTLAVRTEMNEVVNDATDIGEALASADTILVYNDSGTVQRKSALSRVKTYVDTVGTYKTIWVPAKAMTASATAGASAADYEYTTTNDMTHSVMIFAGSSADDFAEFDLVMPEAWDLGTIKYKVYWSNGHADANTGEWVEFYLAAGARSNDDALDATLGTPQSVLDQHITDDDLHITAASSALTVGGTPALGDLIHFKLGRDFDEANGGTAMDVDARVFGVLIQYRENAEVSAW